MLQNGEKKDFLCDNCKILKYICYICLSIDLDQFRSERDYPPECIIVLRLNGLTWQQTVDGIAAQGCGMCKEASRNGMRMTITSVFQ